ncbi:MAG: arsenite methyltransferase [Rhodothermales bacterium]|nr:arsenite methyltransferase [Rhodothermales bacterium]
MTSTTSAPAPCCGDTTAADSTSTPHSASPTDRDRTKELVRERYAHAATQQAGCGCGCGTKEDGDVVGSGSSFSFVGDDYAGRDGYEEEADLGLGCGIPTDVADFREGETVLDLGSGAGIDAFIAARHVGTSGEVLGVDFTPEMVEKAKVNASTLGYPNVRFVLGDIEDLPIPRQSVDLVISNCVLNLVPDKDAAFAEMYRVLKPGGRFAVSDIVTLGPLPERLRESAAMYAGCVAGAIDRGDYLERLRRAGFTDVDVVLERPIEVPEEVLLQVGSTDDIEAFRSSGGIASITVKGTRSVRPSTEGD